MSAVGRHHDSDTLLTVQQVLEIILGTKIEKDRSPNELPSGKRKELVVKNIGDKCDKCALSSCLTQCFSDKCRGTKCAARCILFKLLGYCTMLSLNGAAEENKSGQRGKEVAALRRGLLETFTREHEQDKSSRRTCSDIRWLEMDNNDTPER